MGPFWKIPKFLWSWQLSILTVYEVPNIDHTSKRKIIRCCFKRGLHCCPWANARWKIFSRALHLGRFQRPFSFWRWHLFVKKNPHLLHRIGPKRDIKIKKERDQRWVKKPIKMGPKWDQNGTKKGPKKELKRPKKYLKRNLNEPKMDPKLP